MATPCEDPFVVWGEHCVLPAEERFDRVVLTILGILVFILIVSGIFQCFTRMKIVKKLFKPKEYLEEIVHNAEAALGMPQTEEDPVELEQKAEEKGQKKSLKKTRRRRSVRLANESKENIQCGKVHWMHVTSGLGTRIKKVHKDFLLGIGLPTFYNQHFLIGSSAVIAMAVFRNFPVLESEKQEDVVRHAEEMFNALTTLYVSLMIVAMVFARIQNTYMAWFHSKNTVMHDFAIALDDLPTSMRNENDLLHCLQEHGYEQRFIGASIAYDYTEHVDEVNEIWQHNLVLQDAIYDWRTALKQKSPDTRKKKEKVDELVEKDVEYKEKFKLLFEKLKGSGTAFVVLQSLGQALKIKDSSHGIWLKDSLKFSGERSAEELKNFKEKVKKATIPQSQAVAEPWTILAEDLTVGDLTLPRNSRVRKDGRGNLEYETAFPDKHRVRLNTEQASRDYIKDLAASRDAKGAFDGKQDWHELSNSIKTPSKFLQKGRSVRLHEDNEHLEYQADVKVFGRVAPSEKSERKSFSPSQDPFERKPEDISTHFKDISERLSAIESDCNFGVIDIESRRRSEAQERSLWDEIKQKTLKTEVPWAILSCDVATHEKTDAERLVLPQGTRIKPDHDDKGVDYQFESLVKILANQEEPPSILWENCGTPRSKTRRKMFQSMCLTVLTFCIIFKLVLHPYKAFINDPYLHTGTTPKVVTTQIFGAVVGMLNNILGAVMWQGMWGAGFASWMVLDWHVYYFNVAVSAFNNMFNIAQSIRYTPSLWTVSDDPEYIQSMLDQETFISTKFFEMLIPGWLFSGFLTGQTIGIVLPFVQNLFFLNVIFVWQWFPSWVNKLLVLAVPTNPDPDKSLTKRTAEQIFTPGNLGVCWDYGNIVLTPSLAFMTLLVYKKRPGEIFPWVLGYTVMIYWWHRLVKLKLKSKEMLSGKSLDYAALKTWGLLPLAILAGAIGLWGYRLQYWKSVGITGMVIFHIILYLYGMSKFGYSVRVSELVKEKGYLETARSLKYNWFNSNPIHVLKSRYLPEHLPIMSIAEIPFVYGKEYLLEDPSEIDAPIKEPRGFTEWEEFSCWFPRSLFNYIWNFGSEKEDHHMTEALLGARARSRRKL